MRILKCRGITQPAQGLRSSWINSGAGYKPRGLTPGPTLSATVLYCLSSFICIQIVIDKGTGSFICIQTGMFGWGELLLYWENKGKPEQFGAPTDRWPPYWLTPREWMNLPRERLLKKRRKGSFSGPWERPTFGELPKKEIQKGYWGGETGEEGVRLSSSLSEGSDQQCPSPQSWECCGCDKNQEMATERSNKEIWWFTDKHFSVWWRWKPN